MWAIAKMHVDEDEYLPMDVVRVLEGHIAATIDDFIPQGVSNSLWALGSFNKSGQGFSLTDASARAFGRAVIKNKDGFKSMELSNVVWALSTLRLRVSDDVARAIDDACHREIVENPGGFSSQSVSTSCGPRGTTRKATPRANDCWTPSRTSPCPNSTRSPRRASNTCWGFAAVGYNPGPHFSDALRRRWARDGAAYNVMEMSNLLWAFHTLQEHPGEDTLAVVGRRLLELPDEDLLVQTIANMMYSLAQFEYLPEAGDDASPRGDVRAVASHAREGERHRRAHALEPHMGARRAQVPT